MQSGAGQVLAWCQPGSSSITNKYPKLSLDTTYNKRYIT